LGKEAIIRNKKYCKKYSKKGDLLLDPFSGYGGLGIEGGLLDRNVILNDLNPIVNFISDCILDPNIDIIENIFNTNKKYYQQ